MEFLMEYHLAGIMIGVATFLIIGIFHPLVTKGEYYFGVRIWWIFLLMGIAAVIGSVLVENIVWSTCWQSGAPLRSGVSANCSNSASGSKKGGFPSGLKKRSGSPSLLVGRFPPQPLLPKLMDAFVREGLRMFFFLGLKNDDDDAVIISIRPEALSRPNFSPKCSTPTSTAVSGSIEPRIDVIVEPISLIARTSVRLDTTVGTRASNRRFCQRCHCRAAEHRS